MAKARRGAGAVERGGLENRCPPCGGPRVRIPPSPPPSLSLSCRCRLAPECGGVLRHFRAEPDRRMEGPALLGSAGPDFLCRAVRRCGSVRTGTISYTKAAAARSNPAAV